MVDHEQARAQAACCFWSFVLIVGGRQFGLKIRWLRVQILPGRPASSDVPQATYLSSLASGWVFAPPFTALEASFPG